jgi:membrane-associated phospholipid phosphatase
VYRLQSISEAMREAAPPAATEAFALVTALGGVAVLVVFLSVLYWVDNRESTGVVIAYALVALAVTLVLKSAFALPRPPAAIRAMPVEPGSYGFPSGHAVASTVVYGGLVLVRGKLDDFRVVVPAAVLVGLVGLSRVFVGVHYLGDVLAGHAVGLALLAALWWGVGRRADRACLVAAAVALVGVAVTGASTDSLLAIGGSLGGAVAFRTVDTAALPAPARTEAVVLVAVGLPVAGGLYWLASTVGNAGVAVLGNGALVATVVALPVALQGRLPASLSPE